MSHRRRRIATLLGLLLIAAVVAPRIVRAYDDPYYGSQHERYEERRSRSYNDEYIFATTKMVTNMDVDPAFKVPLFPAAIVVDLVFLPAELIAGVF